MKRREALAGLGGLGALGSWSVLGCTKDRERPTARPAEDTPKPEPPDAEPLRTFGPAERPTMTALLGALLPAVGPMPSARETQVLAFMDSELQKPHFRSMGRFVLQGVRYLNRAAQKFHGQTFAELDPGPKEQLLRRFQTGKVPGLRYPTARFFEVVLILALEGQLGHPRHGGNQGKASWQALGIDPHCPHEAPRE